MYNERIKELVDKNEKECLEEFKKIDERCERNSYKVLSSFQKNEVTESCFNSTTGYGYNDLGRDIIEKVFKDLTEIGSGKVENPYRYLGLRRDK